MADAEGRPDPESLLAEVERAGRGRLKIFLGAAPGVGKTFAMLRAARVAKRDGLDVAIGVVETHGRRETERLLIGLETVPRKVIAYRGRSLPEMDLDAILARRPRRALVDELAHSNVEGSRHPKRWQDVEELLAAGIDVDTTLNVQHLESLNDIVERITGVKVRETVPDAVLEEADEIEVVDLSPEDLQKRLRAGKVYVPDQAERAITRFFSRGNLTALREMALRAAAERVDREMLDYMRAHAVGGAWPTRDRILVCLEGSASAERLVRTAKRMAERSRAPWIVLHLVDSPGGEAEAAADKALALAEALGAETETLVAAGRAPDAILDFARARNVTRIVVARGGRATRWSLSPPLHRALIAFGTGFEVTVVAADDGRDPARRGRAAVLEPGHLRPYALGALFAALAVPVAWGVDQVLPLANLSLVFLSAVLATASFGRVGAAVLTSLLSFAAYNFFFTEPRFTFAMTQGSDVLTLAFFLAVSLVIGVLGARLNRQVAAMRTAARQTRALYEFTRRALTATTDYDMAWTIVSHVHASLGTDAVLLAPDPDARLTVVAGMPPIDTLDPGATAAADYAWRQRTRAGWSTDTLPASPWLFLPLTVGDRALGVLGVSRERPGPRLGAPDRRLLDTLADQGALILERGRMIAEAAEAQRYSQTERLRTALLSSISHDLRTPLVTIIGAVSSLQALGSQLPAGDREDLLDQVAVEAARLNRHIQNLLDMTRLGYGAVAIRREWIDTGDLIESARDRLAARLTDVPVTVEIDPGAALIHADPTLIEQCLVNLLDNAARYAPPGTAVALRATRQGDITTLSVADRGPGVAPELRERIFEMFFRVEAGDRRGEGTGLGLAIVRGFTEAMGGSVRVDEGPAGGAVFAIDLPQPALPVLPRETAHAG